MNILKGINSILSFLLELIMIFVFSYFGYQIGPNTLVKWVLAPGLPFLVVLLWAAFFAPKANWRLSIVPGSLLLLALFLLAAFALCQLRQPIGALVLAVTATGNRMLVLLWQQW